MSFLNELRVLYLIGYGRSGSTLIGNILGEIPGFVHLGELRSLWGLGLLGNRFCGCGLPLNQCPFWEHVLSEAFGADRPVASDVVAWQRSEIRIRKVLSLLRTGSGTLSSSSELSSFADATSRIYRAAASVTRSHVVVDTSKHVPEAALLSLLPGINPYFVHLVRDPRAVAFSWQREMASPGEGRRSMMPKHSLLASIRGWAMTNIGAEFALSRRDPTHHVRIKYEDFVANPRRMVDRIVAMIGCESTGIPFLDCVTVELHLNHTAGGNPSRFTTGRVPILSDDEWKLHQSPLVKYLISGMAFPLMLRYQYPFRVGTHPKG